MAGTLHTHIENAYTMIPDIHLLMQNMHGEDGVRKSVDYFQTQRPKASGRCAGRKEGYTPDPTFGIL